MERPNSSVQYSALRLLHALLFRSARSRTQAFSDEVLLPLCRLLKSSEPDIVRGVCEVLLLYGARDQRGLRSLLDGKGNQTVSLPGSELMEGVLSSLLLDVASGGSVAHHAVNIETQSHHSMTKQFLQMMVLTERTAAMTMASATTPEDDQKWTEEDDAVSLRSMLTSSGMLPTLYS